MYIRRSINKYLKDLAARTPAPGGGSAAALAAAMAAGLVAMAAHFTCGKEKYRAFERRARQILEQSLQMQKRLSALVDKDVAAYQARDPKRSIEVPAEVSFISFDLMKTALEMMERGNRSLATDAGLAAHLAEASFFAGLSYVEVNIRFFKDKAKRHRQALGKLKEMSKKVRLMRQEAEANVGYSSGR